MYTIWFLRPHDRDSPANHGIQLLNATVPITGEFIILRRTIDGERLLDLRRLDNSGMEAALTRLVELLYNSDPLWRTEM
ncbi:hypothetical protein TRAPUB_12516 [Trametes pubescens]|uniref:Uncharacterized protein n=2 Tax=Trametes pubescens TaxID=154538 RepID=A0A1M2VTM7_TRAPU|nr:hypothetical protein TRAPUB_12516 [Trametes pubescens]